MTIHKLIQKNRILLANLGLVIILLLYAPPAWAGDFKWTSIGPTSGQIYALAVDPITPGILYAGAYQGVFKSTNGGNNWTQMNTGLGTNPDVRTLAINPITPSTLYAGAYKGVFKSTNGGNNWTPMNIDLTNHQVWSLAIDPANPDTVFAGTWGGGVFTMTPITFKHVYLPIIIRN